MRHFKHLALQSTATIALLGGLFTPAFAQVNITEGTDQQIRTSDAADDGTASDVVVGAPPADDGTVPDAITITGNTTQPAIILDSSNDITVEQNANIVIDIPTSADQGETDTPTAVLLEGGADRNYTQLGSISITEDFVSENTDDDPFLDGGVADGSGRTGILISGASPFQGNIELTDTSSIVVEGNDSFGINLDNTPMMTDGLTGNLTTGGIINVTGDRSVGVNVASGVTGNLENTGQISVVGEDALGYAVNADIQGGFVNSGGISSNGFRSATRIPFAGPDFDFGREDLTEEDLRQSGSALSIAGDVSGGIFLSQIRTTVLDEDGETVLNDDGTPLEVPTGLQSNIMQFGGAPAVLIGRDGAPISIGVVTQLADEADPDSAESLQFSFINQGVVSANGVFDDVDATAISISNATLTDGFSNDGGTLTASTVRAAVETDLTSEGDGIARVLVLGDNAIVDQINNSGLIIASSEEAEDQVFFDPDAPLAPLRVEAIAIDIGANASVTDLVNSGTITAIIDARSGQAVAVRDSSGTLRTLTNSGLLDTTSIIPDLADPDATNIDLIALDVSASNGGFIFTQIESGSDTFVSRTEGDLLFGSGDDVVSVESGAVIGDVDFGGGNDSFALSGGSTFTGALRNSDGIDLSVTDNSVLNVTSVDPINVSQAIFDETSAFRPIINGETGEASTLIGSGPITFETGATINPQLDSILTGDTGITSQSFELAVSDNLTVGDLTSLSDGITPFLFQSDLSLSDPNTLVITLDLRDPAAAVDAGGLGLDPVQLAAFGQLVADGAGQTFQAGPIFEALVATPQLGNSFANITEAGEFFAAINQVLPEFSGAANQFVLANVDGAVGAVGSHLDTTRRSPERRGGAWLEEFFYFADRELAGQSEQFRGEGFGFTTGIDTEFGPFHAVGVSAGFSSTEVEDVVGIDEDLEVRTYTLGTYAGYEKGGLSIDAFGGVGFNEFEQTRRIQLDNFAGVAEGEWEGLHANATLRAGYHVPISDKFWFRPRASLDYLYLNENGRTETGTQGFRLRVDGRNTQTAAATGILEFGGKFQGRRTWIRPSVRVGYRNEFISDPIETAFRFQGLQGADGELFDSEIATLRSLAFPDDGILLGFTVAAGSEYSSIGFDFDSDIRDGFIRHTGRIVIRLLF